DVISNLPAPIQGIATALSPAMVALNSFGSMLAQLSTYLWSVLTTGDHFRDVVSNMPAPIQGIANAIAPALVALNSLGQAFVNLGKYLWSVITVGDVMNDWITHLPTGFQNAALLMGNAVMAIRTTVTSMVEAIRLALGGDTSQLGQIFMNILPSLVAILVGGLPGLLITA
ncbi:carbamoyl-phosphate synthase, partial [Bacillus pseudomycoides]